MFRVSFTEERLLSGHSAIKPGSVSVAVIVVHLDGSPISRQDLWSSARATIWFFRSGPSSQIAKNSGSASFRNSPGCSKRILFKKYGGHYMYENAITCCWEKKVFRMVKSQSKTTKKSTMKSKLLEDWCQCPHLGVFCIMIVREAAM